MGMVFQLIKIAVSVNISIIPPTPNLLESIQIGITGFVSENCYLLLEKNLSINRWVLRPDFRLPTEKELGALISDDDVLLMSSSTRLRYSTFN